MYESIHARRGNRSWSLRREWTRAFVLMLVLMLGTGACTIVGVWQLVGQLERVAEQRDRETSVVDALRNELVDHEQIGHQLLSGQPIDRPAFLHQQLDIATGFERAIKTFPADNGTQQILRTAQRSWQKGLTDAGLWGDQIVAMTGAHLAENPVFGAASDTARGMLDDLNTPSLNAMHQGLAAGKRLERYMIIFLIALFTLALGVTGHFRRRMSRDLFRPVASMRHGVLKLRSGDLDHHIPITRNDELGELAAAFNAMTDALRQTSNALTQRATCDSLTGLANRHALTEHLLAAFDVNSDRTAACGSLLFLDVDDFKDVNDSLGHEAGDAFLVELVGRLRNCVGPNDLVGRLGGDEFAIVIAQAEGRHSGSEVAERVLAALERPVTVNGRQLAISVSIGVAERRPETADPAELLRHADFAMYMAKGGGKGRYQVYDAQAHDIMVYRAALKADLAGILHHEQLRLHYQPISDLNSGLIVGVEALVRWQHPKLGLLAPDDFIPMAEETGDIEAIGCWVLQTAVNQVADWRQEIAGCSELWVSVNLSAFQLPNPKSLAAIQHILEGPTAQAVAVVLEVTETALAASIQGGIASINILRTCGARIAIDDFGAGFSSLSTLASLPIDILKIDRSFVSGSGSSTPSEPILEGIIALAHKLSLDVIAEGVEEPEQLALLRHLGCALGQGYLLARPASAENVSQLLRSGRLLYPATVGVTAASSAAALQG
jgi:diguanylate cyclase (GGDEF)-like protein